MNKNIIKATIRSLEGTILQSAREMYSRFDLDAFSDDRAPGPDSKSLSTILTTVVNVAGCCCRPRLTAPVLPHDMQHPRSGMVRRAL